MKKSILAESVKKFLKFLSCFFRNFNRFGTDTYVSPLSRIKNSKRVSLGNNVTLEGHSRINANGDNAEIVIGDYTIIYPYSLLKCNGGNITLGRACALNDYSIIYGSGGVEIGDQVHIAAHVVIVAGDHKIENIGTQLFSSDMSKKGIKIESKVWIGANAVILDGVTIGAGSVIGAGAVVTKDIPANSLALGVPAVVKKKLK